MSEKEKRSVPGAEQSRLSREVLAWVNTCPVIPDGVDLIQYEYLPDSAPSMALSSIQAAYIMQKYIAGGYLAEYQFKLIYRVSPGNSNDKRLQADEALNTIAEWVEANAPATFGENQRVTRLEATTMAAMFARYEDGTEDHQTLFKLKYEVNV